MGAFVALLAIWVEWELRGLLSSWATPGVWFVCGRSLTSLSDGATLDGPRCAANVAGAC
jgi:hypothetical protein